MFDLSKLHNPYFTSSTYMKHALATATLLSNKNDMEHQAVTLPYAHDGLAFAGLDFHHLSQLQIQRLATQSTRAARTLGGLHNAWLASSKRTC